MFQISFFSEILALAFGLSYYFKLKPVVLRLLVPLLLITVLNEGFAFFRVYSSAGLNKNHFYIGFFLLEMMIFFYVFRSWFKEDKKSKKLADLIFLISVVLSVFTLFMWGYNKLNPFFLNVVCLCMIGFGFLYYRFVFRINKVYFFRKDPMFWLSSGVVFVNFLHFLFVNAVFIDSFRNNRSSAEVFQVLNTIGNLFYYGCIIIAFICSSRYPRQVGT